MKRLLITILLVAISFPAFARVRVVTAYPYIADIAKRIGKDKIHVGALAPGNWDPHFVVPRPSLIAKVRRADLLIINGAEVEIGWMPPIIRDAKNRKVQPGKTGFLDLSAYVRLIEVPKNVSRAHGDIHPSGNPHFYLDPGNIPRLARAISQKLCAIDSSNCSTYKQNYKIFRMAWRNKLKAWDNRMKSFKGTKIVQYHRQHNYFYKRYGIVSIMEIEPLPGIPPTSRHTQKVIGAMKRQNIKIVVNDVFHSKRAAEFVAQKAGARLVILPHDVNAVSGANSIFGLFDELVRRFAND